MTANLEFKCTGDSLEQVPEEIIQCTGISFPLAHLDHSKMALLAKELKNYKRDFTCRVPFCVTVEAEALGAKINLGNEKIGPRVASYAFSSLEELAAIKKIDLTQGRIKEVLNSVKLLRDQGETVTLNVEGPFTIISSLIEPLTFYKGVRKNPEVVRRILEIIEESIIAYAQQGLEMGASIISYGDPVGTLDIVGPKIFRDFSGPASYNILKRMAELKGKAIIHVCGKTSTALEKFELTKSEPMKSETGITYGQAMARILKEQQETIIIGHRCIKKTPFRMNSPVVWRIY